MCIWACLSHESIKEWPTPDHMCPLRTGKNNIVHTNTLTPRLLSIMDISRVGDHRVTERKREGHGVMLSWHEEGHGNIFFSSCSLFSKVHWHKPTVVSMTFVCFSSGCIRVQGPTRLGQNPQQREGVSAISKQRTGQCRRSRKGSEKTNNNNHKRTDSWCSGVITTIEPTSLLVVDGMTQCSGWGWLMTTCGSTNSVRSHPTSDRPYPQGCGF